MAYSYPLQSLQDSCWFKLICGASFQHLPAVRNLTLSYALAGADCIDVAADPAVVAAARDGIQAMQALVRGQSVTPLSPSLGPGLIKKGSATLGFNPNASNHLPWLMVSLNDGEDPHFRKVTFDPERCPQDCPRPCESICPAQAIVFPSSSSAVETVPPPQAGVIRDRCYGCGRCIPVCPIQHIEPQSYIVSPDAIAPSLLPQVDAIEIHTQVGRTEQFQTLWQQIRPHINHLKLVAVSCPDAQTAKGKVPDGDISAGDPFIDYLQSLHHIMTDGGRQPLPGALLWQTDGRPMSGDIGKGTTHAAVRLAQKAIAAQLPGFVQLAGGTNAHTVPTLRRLGLLSRPPLAGVAYGSYARKLLTPVLEALEADRDFGPVQHTNHRQTPFPQPSFSRSLSSSNEYLSNECLSNCLETVPELLSEAVNRAASLISPLKALTHNTGAIQALHRHTNAPVLPKEPVLVKDYHSPPVADGPSTVGSSVHL